MMYPGLLLVPLCSSLPATTHSGKTNLLAQKQFKFQWETVNNNWAGTV